MVYTLGLINSKMEQTTTQFNVMTAGTKLILFIRRKGLQSHEHKASGH